MTITLTGGELDSAGAAFGVARRSSEDDAAFRLRVEAAVRKSSTTCPYCGLDDHLRHCPCGSAMRPSGDGCRNTECLSKAPLSFHGWHLQGHT